MDSKTLSKLKHAARSLKRNSALTHAQALDEIAREQGANDWAHLMLKSRPRNLPAVAGLPVPKHRTEIFHHVAIEGMEFTGTVSVDHGLFLNGPKIHSGIYDGQVHLGVCRITHFGASNHRVGSHRVAAGDWWVCKYQGENRINVTSLTDGGRLALAREFGLAVGLDEADDFGRRFVLSPAFDALITWVKKHPRLAKRAGLRHNPYVPRWYQHVMARLSPNATGSASNKEIA